jgi:citrate lyase subunit beta/citryl-CoA lyase
MLYIPACVPRFLAKGRSLKVDSLIFDLEESVLVARKSEARRNAVAALEQGGYGQREIVVRVNRHDSAWGLDDLTAVVPAIKALDGPPRERLAAPLGGESGPKDLTGGSHSHAILFPRSESRQDVLDALAALDAAGGAHLPIMVMIETPMAVLRAEEIAGASPRLLALVMGTSDLTNELHARITPDRMAVHYSLSHCLLAARAHGLAILDGVHLDMKDMTGFEFACRMARDLGYDGKTVVHPDQIAYANDAFTPRPVSVERARKVIAAFAEANAQGLGVTVVDGRLVENLHVEAARRTLMIHDMIDALAREETTAGSAPARPLEGGATPPSGRMSHSDRRAVQ